MPTPLKSALTDLSPRQDPIICVQVFSETNMLQHGNHLPFQAGQTCSGSLVHCGPLVGSHHPLRGWVLSPWTGVPADPFQNTLHKWSAASHAATPRPIPPCHVPWQASLQQNSSKQDNKQGLMTSFSRSSMDCRYCCLPSWDSSFFFK